MSFDHRAYIFVEWNKRNVANNWAKLWDPDTGGDQTFGDAKLSVGGNEPPTHTACNTQATDEMNNGIQQALANVPFVAVYYQADGWTWETALADIDLQVINS